jgi:glycine/serine hydroxymethyltransferase
MKETEMSQIGRWIAEVLLHRADTAALSRVRKQVLDLCEAYPLYADRRAKAQAEVRA